MRHIPFHLLQFLSVFIMNWFLFLSRFPYSVSWLNNRKRKDIYHLSMCSILLSTRLHSANEKRDSFKNPFFFVNRHENCLIYINSMENPLMIWRKIKYRIWILIILNSYYSFDVILSFFFVSIIFLPRIFTWDFFFRLMMSSGEKLDGQIIQPFSIVSPTQNLATKKTDKPSINQNTRKKKHFANIAAKPSHSEYVLKWPINKDLNDNVVIY